MLSKNYEGFDLLGIAEEGGRQVEEHAEVVVGALAQVAHVRELVPLGHTFAADEGGKWRSGARVVCVYRGNDMLCGVSGLLLAGFAIFVRVLVVLTAEGVSVYERVRK